MILDASTGRIDDVDPYLLRLLGYTVIPTANGIDALGAMQHRGVGHVDLLFTDVVMPHMSGTELADRVRALHPHTRILYTSAYTESAVVEQGMLARGGSLLQKPYSPSALAVRIRGVLDHPGSKTEAVSPDAPLRRPVDRS